MIMKPMRLNAKKPLNGAGVFGVLMAIVVLMIAIGADQDGNGTQRRTKKMLEPMDSFSAWIMIAFFSAVLVFSKLLQNYIDKRKEDDARRLR